MRLLISFAALFLSLALLQLSSGGVAPLDALSGLKLGFTQQQIGLLGSAHFIGFFLGCWWAPRWMGTIGHSRAFAAFAAAGAIGLISHTLTVNPYLWALFRVASGICVAGSYTVIEAWLHAKTSNELRGRMSGTYRIVDIGSSMCAQLLIAVLEPASYVSYNILVILCCASLWPLTLSTSKQPPTPEAPRLRPTLAWQISPLAAVGVVIAALSSSAFRMVSPLYGQDIGLRVDQIAFFLAAFTLGGALAQYPVGWLADKYDRRWVLFWVSIVSIISCAITMAMPGNSTGLAMLSAGFFGFATMPVFSISAAHANDFATEEQRVELSAALMFCYALGAIASPYAASTLISMFGAKSMFVFIASGHALLAIFGLQRMSKRKTVQKRTPYTYTPRTSFIVGKLMSRFRDRQ